MEAPVLENWGEIKTGRILGWEGRKEVMEEEYHRGNIMGTGGWVACWLRREVQHKQASKSNSDSSPKTLKVSLYSWRLCVIMHSDWTLRDAEARVKDERQEEKSGCLWNSSVPVHSKHAVRISIPWSGPRMHIHLPLTKQIAVHPTLWPQSQWGEARSSLTQIRVN